MVAGAVALIATGVGAFGGAALLGQTAAGLAQIAAIAGVVSSVAMLGAQLLTKPPPARGSVSQVVIGVDPPRPYVMGEGYCGGVRRYQRAYGGTVDDVPNPYRFIVDVYCGHGPVGSISPRFDYEAVSSYYSTYLYTTTQLGAVPESGVLTPNWSGAPNWSTSTAKLSGCAAIGWNFKFDKDGKRFASGIPVMGAYGQWVKVYDPRLDSTQPGGSGAHRLGTESTYTYSENPALHYAMYAYGRYQNGKLVMGVGLPAQSIDWTKIAAYANVCDANDWTIFGRVFEPGDRAANLRDIAEAGGGAPAFSGGLLSVHYNAPQSPLATITADDLGPGEVVVPGMRPYAERMNTAVPKFTDPDSNWEQVSAAPVTFSALVTGDGEERRQEWPFNLVKDVDQASQLAAYRILDSRERAPIELTLMPQWRYVRPGECYTLDLPDYGLQTDVIVLRKELDPKTLVVKLTVQTETSGKHAQALAVTGTGPGGTSGALTGQDRDTMGDWLRGPRDGFVYDANLAAP
jgi:hypothetical protein